MAVKYPTPSRASRLNARAQSALVVFSYVQARLCLGASDGPTFFVIAVGVPVNRVCLDTS